jgi:hypothetical protein
MSQNSGRDRGAAVVPGAGLVEVRAVVAEVGSGRVGAVGSAVPLVQAAATNETATRRDLSERMRRESTGGLTGE